MGYGIPKDHHTGGVLSPEYLKDREGYYPLRVAVPEDYVDFYTRVARRLGLKRSEVKAAMLAEGYRENV